MSLLVIADDLTGAAEMASLAHEQGLKSALVLDLLAAPPDAEVVVYDTNSRLDTPAEATRKINALLASLPLARFSVAYKKTDSVLRGQVAAECAALALGLGLSGVLLCPCNPSFGRIIQNGRYSIKGVPLHETPFAKDPHHPAFTDEALKLLHDSPWPAFLIEEPYPLSNYKAGSLLLAGAATFEQVRHLADQWCDHYLASTGKAASPDTDRLPNPPSALWTAGLPTGLQPSALWTAGLPTGLQPSAFSLQPSPFLPAGGADFFRALLQSLPSALLASRSSLLTSFSLPPSAFSLLLSGSLSASSLAERNAAIAAGLPSSPMPAELLSCGSAENPALKAWIDRTFGLLTRHSSVVAFAPESSDAGASTQANENVRNHFANLALALHQRGAIHHLLAEGGSVAAAAAAKLGWSGFEVAAVQAPGVVSLRPCAAPNITFTIKPGSYSWSPKIWNSLSSSIPTEKEQEARSEERA